jgi:hypothetical protein
LFPSQFTAITSTDMITPIVLSPNVAQRMLLWRLRGVKRK